jgi:hypothetical protein
VRVVARFFKRRSAIGRGSTLPQQPTAVAAIILYPKFALLVGDFSATACAFVLIDGFFLCDDELSIL